jgi:hypothetical protein
MRPQARDTSVEIEKIKLEALRQMTPGQRLQLMAQMNAFVAASQRAAILRDHPNADEREITFRLASRRVDKDLLKKLTGWDVDVEGY